MDRLMQLFRKLFTGRKLLVNLVLFLGLIIGFAVFQNIYIIPKQKKIEVARKNLIQLTSEMSALQIRVDDKKLRARQEAIVLEKYRSLEERLERAKEMLPNRNDVSGLLEGLTEPGKRTGVSVLSLLPYPPEDMPKLTKFSFKLQLEGKYRNIGRYLAVLESLDRLIVVDNVQLTGSEGNSRNVQAQVLASTYLFKEER
ncbi:MAG: type 4a pilus biogenesis protein PilO [bacterium]